jgi:L-asparaginase II
VTTEYYTYRIRIANCDRLQVENRGYQNQDTKQPQIQLRYRNHLTDEIKNSLQPAGNGINVPNYTIQLKEALFNVLK